LSGLWKDEQERARPTREGEANTGGRGSCRAEDKRGEREGEATAGPPITTARQEPRPPVFASPSQHVQRGIAWLVEAVESGRFREPSPIGFYFAKLWYFEKLYPLIFTVAALGRARLKSYGASASVEPT